jgi:hypothetical protein
VVEKKGDAMQRLLARGFVLLCFAMLAGLAENQIEPQQPESAQTPADPETLTPPSAGMTADRLDELIVRVGQDLERNSNQWTFTVEQAQVIVVVDEDADRMRIISPIDKLENVTPDLQLRLLQANFDAALDARYAVAQDILWAAFIHPLSALDDDEFLSGLGQTVNLYKNYGGTFSSGALFYGGGDSRDLIARDLILELLKKGGDPI